MIEGISAVMRHPLPVYPDKQTFSEPVGASHLCQQATFHFGRFAPQRRGVNFLQSLVSGVPPQHQLMILSPCRCCARPSSLVPILYRS